MCNICYLKVAMFFSKTEKVNAIPTDMFLSLFTCFVFCIDLCPCLIHCFTPLIVSKRNHFFLVTDGKHQITATVQHVYGTFFMVEEME